MNASFHLCRHGSLFKLQLSGVHHGTVEDGRAGVKHGAQQSLHCILTHTDCSPEDRKTLGPDVLAAMLDTSYQVRYKLVDGALVLDRARHPLGHLHIVALAVGGRQSILHHTV